MILTHDNHHDNSHQLLQKSFYLNYYIILYYLSVGIHLRVCKYLYRCVCVNTSTKNADKNTTKMHANSTDTVDIHFYTRVKTCKCTHLSCSTDSRNISVRGTQARQTTDPDL